MGKRTEQNFFKGRNPNGQKHMKKWAPSLAIKEMRIKTTLRFHLTPVRIATIKNTNNNKYWQGCGDKRTQIHCWWEHKFV
jgi:acyl-ACP thioesterase